MKVLIRYNLSMGSLNTSDISSDIKVAILNAQNQNRFAFGIGNKPIENFDIHLVPQK